MKHNHSHKHLRTICDETHSLRAKIAWLSIKDAPVLKSHDYLLASLDCIQILAPILLFCVYFANAQETTLPFVIAQICRIVDAGSWITFSQIGNFEMVILSLVAGFMILKYLLFGYIALVAREKVAHWKPLVQIWRYCFRVQTKYLYFVCSSFWTKAIYILMTTRDEISSSKYYGMMTVSSLLMATEFIFSMHLSIYYFDILPSQQFLSAKRNGIEITGLVQKLIIQIFALKVDFSQLSSLWIFTLVNLFIDAVRNIYYFKTLPFYSFKTLFYQGAMLMLMTSLNISCVMTTIFRAIDLDSSRLVMTIIMWIILALLLVKSSQTFLERQFWDILLNPLIKDTNLLIQRISAITELRAMTEMHFEYNEKYSWTFLANNSINSRINEIMKVSSSEEFPLDINNRESWNKILCNYLQKLLEEHPKNKFLRLYTAHFYIKNLEQIRAPIDIITKLPNNSGLWLDLNAELLLMEIQNLLNLEYSHLSEDRENHLDLTKYLNEKILYIQAREKIIAQAELQINICNEVKKESPDLYKIFHDSQKLNFKRLQMNKFIRDSLTKFSDYHIQPLFLYAKYHLVLNHSVQNNSQFTKLYAQKLQKYQKYFDQDKLIKENVFQYGVDYCIYSSNEARIGKTFYACKGMTRMLGQSTDSLTAINVIKNVPPCFRESHVEIYRNISKQGEQALIWNIHRNFVCSGEGYLTEVDLYLNIHPFVTSEFYLHFMQRIVKNSNKEFMYVLENGDIDCTTKDIGQKLGVNPSRSNSSPGTEFNLQDISNELLDINNAFNMVHSAEGTEKEKAQAQEIFTVYTTTGKDVILRPTICFSQAKREDVCYVYKCKVINIDIGKSLVNLFTFEEKNTHGGKRFTGLEGQTPVSNILETQSPTKHSPGFEITVGDIQEGDDSCNITEQEKDKGWIDFNAMSSRVTYFDYNTTNRTLMADMLTTQRGANEKETFRDLLEIKDGKLDSPLKSRNQQEEHNFSFDSTGGRNTQQTEAKRTKNHHHVKPKLSIGTRFSQQKRVFYLYETSLNTKYYPKLYKLLLYLCFFAFAVLLAGEFSLKRTLDENVEDLRISKDILSDAQSRNYLQVVIGTSTRMIWELNFGSFGVSSFGSFAYLIPVYPLIFASYLEQLSEANQNLFSSCTTLDQETQQELFAANVKVYDAYFNEADQTYTKLNSFQAVNSLVEVGMRIPDIAGLGKSEASRLVKFILRNSFNALLLKNEEISETILSSLNDQRKLIETNITVFCVVLLAIFGGFGVLVTLILWQQYLKQMRNLSAFCRVHPTKLNEVLHDFLRFKQAVENEQIEYQNDQPRRFKTLHHEAIKRDYNKTSDCWKLQKSYYILVSKLIFLITIIIITIIITSLVNQQAIKSSKTMQNQIYFLDHSSSRIGLTSGAFFELILTNNSAYIEENIVLDEFQSLVPELDDIRVKIYDTLIDSSAEEDDEVSEHIDAILYGEEACEMLELLPRKSCLEVSSRGYKPGLVYILSGFTNMVRGIIEKYEDSNKTKAALVEISDEFFEEQYLLHIVARGEIDALSSFIDKKFEKDLSHTHNERIIVVIVYVFLVIVVSWLVWRIVLVKLRESINEFKNVLSVLPGDLVLASFILRNFMLKTSPGILDAVKNEFSN